MLRENFDSVLYMQHIRESVQRTDFAFQFAMAGREAEAHKLHADNWTVFDENLEKERGNITVPGERELVGQLDELSGFYQKKGFRILRDAQPRTATSDLSWRTTQTRKNR